MNKKFYAVKNGRQIGIFDTWDKCKELTSGYPNAIFKSFKSYDEALDYLNLKKDSFSSTPSFPNTDENFANENYDDILSSLQKDTMITYIDGSYDDTIKYFSYAGIMFFNGVSEEFSFASSQEDLISMRNVSGEVKASMYVIQKAIDYKMKEIFIFHDYSGISHWAKGEWKTNNHLTKSYRQFYMENEKKIQINFIKVKSHSNIKYNEIADNLAKKAILNIKNKLNKL